MNATTNNLKSKSLSLAIALMLAASISHAETPETADAAEQPHRLETTDVIGEREVQPKPTISRSQLEADELTRPVQVYDRSVIEDIQPARIEQVFTLSPNVTYQGTGDGRDNSFVIRGFANSDLITDGFQYLSSIADPEVYNFEQMEVMKGADSILYGASSPGGLISVTSKRAGINAVNQAVLEMDSFGGVSPKIDLNGRLNEAGTANFRLVGVYANKPSWRQFDTNAERVFIAPSMRVNFSEATQLMVFAEFTDDEKYNDMGTAINPAGNAVAPLDVPTTNPSDTFITDQTIVGADLTHHFGETWTAQLKGRYLEGGLDFGKIWLPFTYAADRVIRVPATQANEHDETTLQANLLGDLSLAGMRHRITLGIDWSDGFDKYEGCFDPSTRDLLDLNNPVYPDPIPACDTTLLPNTVVYSTPGTNFDKFGVFFQDTISFNDHWHLNIGMRQQQAKAASAGGAYDVQYDESKFIPQIGLMFDINDTLSAYASHSESFTPSSAKDRNQNILPPEEGKGWQAGFKGSINDGLLTWNAAYFDVVKTNVAMADPEVPFASIASGKQHSHGLEFDAMGRLTEQLYVLASYGWLETKDKGSNYGKDLIGAPNHTSSVWLSYTINDEWLIGGGYQFVGERAASANNMATLDAYTLLNAAVTWQRDDWRIQLNLNNLTDEEYIESSIGSLARLNYPGDPFNAVLNVMYEF